ncbi:hypothetical protein TNIN_133201 [Trichonephila inaurata madagascariensis]|uniref:Uncharacterized protein n=1 Tax=Trichonephila inaurata madagascariensis TaxID=2747483 RepID=A0A8X6X3X4_9ARAC|nr:hypothetical protein TNIN_133201 [Trichonephila inaurata madagascariensis]
MRGTPHLDIQIFLRTSITAYACQSGTEIALSHNKEYVTNASVSAISNGPATSGTIISRGQLKLYNSATFLLVILGPLRHYMCEDC